jgi:hypothetical protein
MIRLLLGLYDSTKIDSTPFEAIQTRQMWIVPRLTGFFRRTMSAALTYGW